MPQNFVESEIFQALICLFNFQTNRSIETLQNKWKNVKQVARKREALRKKAQNQTGGGTLSKTEQRIVDSPLFADVATKMGASASGNSSRFDSDLGNLVPIPPTSRLANAIAYDEDSQMSFGSSMNNLAVDGGSDDDDGGVSTVKKASKRSRSKSVASTSAESFLSSSTTSKNIRDVRADTVIQLSEFLSKNTEGVELHTQLLRQQIDCEEKSNERTDLQLRKSKAEAEKAELDLKKAKIDLELAESLKDIEVQKAQKLADMEIEAQRKRLGL